MTDDMTCTKLGRRREPLPPGVRRRERVIGVVTAEEREIVQRAADAAGLTVSKYVRRVALAAARTEEESAR